MLPKCIVNFTISTQDNKRDGQWGGFLSVLFPQFHYIDDVSRGQVMVKSSFLHEITSVKSETNQSLD